MYGTIPKKQIALYGKGGIGKSTTSANVSAALAERGLDILHKIQKLERVVVKIHDEDFPEITEVDAKLIKLAKVLDAKIFTNDFNLNKVAELEGVTVLNINDLSNALKSVVLPGELLEVKIVKEGKEYNQGVAYLDDGTMVVVEEGRKIIGQVVEVTVTSVLQTSAGRMIFGKIDSDKSDPTQGGRGRRTA